MGTELTDQTQSESLPDMVAMAASGMVEEVATAMPPWLDERSASLVRAIIAILAQRHPYLRAVILYGSVARHEERPLSDPETSDIDLLLLLDLEPELSYIPYDRGIDLFHSIGIAESRYPHTPREVQVMLAWRDLADWDPTFVESVARDGILLWARGPLPACLAPVETRRSQAPSLP